MCIIDSLPGVIFFHIREPNKIYQYRKIAQEKRKHVITLFIHRDQAKADDHQWDDLEKYNYDYRVLNNSSLEVLQKEAELFADLLIRRLHA